VALSTLVYKTNKSIRHNDHEQNQANQSGVSSGGHKAISSLYEGSFSQRFPSLANRVSLRTCSKCGFTLGALFGLEQISTSGLDRYLVVQNHVHWTFSLVLDYMPKKPIKLNRSVPPIIITFHALPRMLGFKLVSMPDTHFFSSHAIHGTVGAKFNYVAEETALVQITNLLSAPFPERLLNAVTRSLVSGDNFYQAIKCLIDELIHIRPNFLLYPTDKDFPCYFAAMLAGNLDGDYDIEILKNSIVDSAASLTASFLMIDYANDRQVCVNLIGHDARQSASLDVSRVIEE